jgi:hypothetical protein
MSRPPHPPCFDYPNIFGREVHVADLLAMYCFPPSYLVRNKHLESLDIFTVVIIKTVIFWRFGTEEGESLFVLNVGISPQFYIVEVPIKPQSIKLYPS